MANSFDLMNKQRRMQQAMQASLTLMGTEAVNYFKGSFRRQGWNGKLWQKRKANAKRNKGRAIMVNSARLKNSIEKKKRTGFIQYIGTDVPYARVHNEGGQIVTHARSEIFKRNRYTKGAKKGLFKKGVTAGQGFSYKGGTRKMPQRQFMGTTAELTKQLQKILSQQMATVK